ncbi:MAG: pseudouridine synthase [Gammaproteobacteria bacterium]
MGERIQKVLAEAGLGSRRQIEAWIAEGRVAVNGRRAQLGDRIEGTERIVVNGRPIRLKHRSTRHAHIAYHKPAGEVTTRHDPERRPTVFERLPPAPRGRWISVGRLDFNTSGLLLLTTDGELAHRLMHPRYEITREYAVRLLGEPTRSQLETLLSGVQLEDGLAKFDSIDVRGGSGRNTWLHVTLKEGRNREVRRMFQALGLTVSRLIRVRYGPIELGRIQRARTRELAEEEVAALYASVGMEPPTDERGTRESRPTARGKTAVRRAGTRRR